MVDFFKKYSAPIVFFLALAVAVTLIASLPFSILQSESTQLFSSKTTLSTTGWSYQSSTGERLPVSEFSRNATNTTDKALELYTHITAAQGDDLVVCIQTKNEFVRAFFSENLIYDYNYNTQGFGHELGAVWNVIRLPYSENGGELHISLEPSSGNHGTAPYTIYMGAEQAVVSELLLNNLFYLIVCVFMLMAAMVLLCAFFIGTVKKHRNAFGYLYLGLFVLLATLWTASDALLFQFVMPNKAMSFLIFNFSFILMPVPFSLYMGTVFKKNKLNFDIVSALTCVFFFIRLVLYAFGLRDFEWALWMCHLIMGVLIVSAVVLCIRNRDDEKRKYIFAAIIMLSVFSSVSLIVFYLKNILEVNRCNYSTYFYFGIFIFFAIIVYGMFKQNYVKNRLAERATYFEKQARMDSLTGLRNRAAFEEKLTQLDKQMTSLKSVCMLVFDLNNLKKTNDTYGHNVGDELLINTFKCVRDIFGRNGEVYRTGGDEAVVIKTDIDKSVIEAEKNAFEAAVEEYNGERMIPIDVAYGMVFYDNVDTQNLRATDYFRLADSEMYADKQRKKQEKQ